MVKKQHIVVDRVRIDRNIGSVRNRTHTYLVIGFQIVLPTLDHATVIRREDDPCPHCLGAKETTTLWNSIFRIASNMTEGTVYNVHLFFNIDLYFTSDLETEWEFTRTHSHSLYNAICTNIKATSANNSNYHFPPERVFSTSYPSSARW
jgi:hypothetical protein